ncbi:MAG: methyltransferase domain-containing protein, partial [Candidatus Thiodiazotropha sp. 6PLUC5]
LANIHLLGMNAKELSANQSASNSTLQDLNKSPTLPFENNSLDAIISTASIEYLCRPTEVLTEALRVLRPGGITVISFSNRWFPTKAIRVWSELHMFERIGMVSQWLQRAGYTRMHTFSSRGWPRPADDTHAGQTPYSDPVFAVWGFKP